MAGPGDAIIRRIALSRIALSSRTSWAAAGWRRWRRLALAAAVAGLMAGPAAAAWAGPAAREPPQQLRAFQRVTLRPGQGAVVHFSVLASSLAYWGTTTQGWVTAPGTYQVYVGESSALGNLPLRGQFSLGGL